MAKQKVNKKPTSAQRTNAQSLWNRRYFFHALIFVFSFFLYANTISHDYNMDDELVTKNHRLTAKGISALPEIFTSAYYEDGMGYSFGYRPVVLATFAVEHQFFGDNAHVSHFFNALLYSLCCVLLLLVLQELFQQFSPAIPLAVALLFAAHPVHTEVVSSIKNRDEILALGFAFLALLFALKAVNQKRKWLLVAMSLFFAVAMMSKTTVLSFVVLIPLALMFFTETSPSILAIVALFLLLPAYFLLDLNSGFDRFKIIGVVAVMIALSYFVKNIRSYFPVLKDKAGSFIKGMGSVQWSASIPASDSFKDFFKEMIPDRKVFAIVPAIIMLLLGGIYGLLITHVYTQAAFSILIILMLLAWFGKNAVSWWANAVLTGCLAFNGILLYYYGDRVFLSFDGRISNYLLSYDRYMANYFAFFLVFGKRNLALPNLIGYCIILAFNGHFGSVLENLFVLPFMFAMSIRRFSFFVLIIPVFALVYSLADVGRIEDWSYAVYLAIILSFIFFGRKGTKSIGWIFAIAALVIFHSVRLGSEQNLIPRVSQSFDAMQNVANKANPQIIAKPQNRPLSFVEQCVSFADPQTVRIGTSLEILSYYLQKVAVPYPLSFYYGYKFIQPQKITDTVPLISLVLHLLIFIAALLLMFNEPLISFGLFTYLFSIATFSGYFYFLPGMVGERYLLVPSLGWCMVVVGVLRKFSGIHDNSGNINWAAIKPVAKYVFTCILVSYSVLTVSRNTYWKDDLTLFRHDIAYVSRSAQAHNLLAVHLMQASEHEPDPGQRTLLVREALEHFKASQNIYPGFFNVAFDIGRAYRALNIPDSALIAFKYSLTIDSTYAEVYRNIGEVYNAKRAFEEAIPYFDSFIKLYPKGYVGYSGLSYDYFALKQYEKSIAVNRAAIVAIPNLPDPYINIGQTFKAMNQMDSARYYLETANRMFPNNPQVRSLLQQVSVNPVR